ncbi:Gag-Pol polyprotein [Plakobranchus ocellatus]|uniref:Gag-Pol polyprotein n=1 Tax=Plakobranchus ocellatus TaxID=259542 RepID=A0AAV4D8J0_9GAST|nr:Gag-Pol polyprotein [Plakobranchus ocellatus]
MFRELYDYISKCIPCNERNLKKNRPPLKTTEIPSYPWAKVNLDISGPFPLSLSGNKQIASFIDNLTGYPEAFAIPDKSAVTMVSLLLNDVFPRIGCPLVLVTDNGTENVNKIMQKTLKELKIHHVKTSVYYPQTNARVERYHRTLNAVLGKFLVGQRTSTWDLFLPQALAAIRFNSHETTGHSPFSSCMVEMSSSQLTVSCSPEEIITATKRIKFSCKLSVKPF